MSIEADDSFSFFLSHLIDRAAQRAPLIERRRPARFEPRAGGGGAITAEPIQDAEASRGPSASASPSPPPSAEPLPIPRPMRPERGAEASLPPVAALAPAAAMPRAASPQPAAPPPTQAAPLPAVTPLVADTSQRPAARGDDADAQRHKASDRIGQTAVDTAAPSPAARRDGADAATRSESPVKHVIERRTQEIVRDARPLPPPRIPEASRMQAARTSAPVNASTQPPASTRRLPATTPPPPPATAPAPVHISIGRIEVRASSPAPSHAAPKAARAAGPRLSLDEYLRSRGSNGGSTR